MDLGRNAMKSRYLFIGAAILFVVALFLPREFRDGAIVASFWSSLCLILSLLLGVSGVYLIINRNL